LESDVVSLPPFRRVFFGTPERLTRIGTGRLGGKGAGLRFMRDVLEARVPDGRLGDVRIDVPALTILGTDVFDRFLQLNHLHDVLGAGLDDDRLALAFQQTELPPEIVGDLRALVEQVRTPLAVRSSSLLEDALARPFAGVYVTKMIPNHQPDATSRFRRLTEAIKFVYASTYASAARRYRARTGQPEAAEKMAVVVQEVVGRRHLDRFYPDVSGVARSWNYYRFGRARPEDGVVVLALGLGKTIVDGGVAWSYVPRLPRAVPPFASARDLLERTQQAFWAVHIGSAGIYDPTRETEFLVHASLADAEFDGTLRHTASTYDPQADRLTPGVGRPGARAITFAPLLDLETVRLNDAIRQLVRIAEDAASGAVEIEFAITIDGGAGAAARIGFLQVRPMVVPSEVVSVDDEEMTPARALAFTRDGLGNAVVDDLRDIVYLPPERFEARHTGAIAQELDAINRALVSENRPYVLIGFGRWGTSDPWLGVPVTWDQIAGARIIVEAQLGSLAPEPSQGSHFFHNLSSFGVGYFPVPLADPIDWGWLAAQPARAETPFARHVRLDAPLTAKVDGRTGRGVILKP
jgi:hypothetical protein